MRIEVIITGRGVEVYSPYCRQFTKFAQERGGSWSDGKKCWIFDQRDEIAVRNTMIDIYGTDDYASCATVDVRVNLDDFNSRVTAMFIAGREVASRKYADSYVKLGEGVVIIEGGFPPSAPSRQPVCQANDGTVLEIRDIPVQKAAALRKQHPDSVTFASDFNPAKIEDEIHFLNLKIKALQEVLDTLSEEVYDDDDVTGIIPDLRD